MKKQKDDGIKIVTSCIHKGGTGKTTCAVHLVHRLNQAGHKVMLVDCDTQGNATQAFLDERLQVGGASALFEKGGADAEIFETEEGVLVVPADEQLVDVERLPMGAEKQFRANLRRLAAEYEATYVVIDTPPTMGFGMLAPLIASDYAFSPIVPDPYGVAGVASLFNRVTQVRDQFNPSLTYLGVLINRWNSRSADQIKAVNSIEQNLSGHVIPYKIGERSAIARVAFDRLPVWQYRSGAARVASKEMCGALDWIITEMEKN